MAFRQFPATTRDGESCIVIEFLDEPGSSQDSTSPQTPRYELADGRPLLRRGSTLFSADGEVNLSMNQPYRA
ncbi:MULTISPECIES: hypothetical protein [Stenotrophomonas]|uniref:hypothetical protein n=1 Tax=Stenotrophomonas TaxID=40323 RepID=UPI0007706C6F|nr:MULTISPECIES: hypothetical protein [Stenotrophomonas]AMJ55463.1 hypothetical protein AXG53_01530 [Stenotrophomonas sp. KCTC 12332]